MGRFSFGSWQNKGAIVRNVFFANLPQLLLSIAQFWCTSQVRKLKEAILLMHLFTEYLGAPLRGNPLINQPSRQSQYSSKTLSWLQSGIKVALDIG